LRRKGIYEENLLSLLKPLQGAKYVVYLSIPLFILSMTYTRSLFLLLVLLAGLSSTASAQSREVGARRLILDNGLGQTITLQTPAGGWSGNLTLSLPVPPTGAPASAFTYPGTVSNQFLTWVMPNATGPAPNNYPGGDQGSWQPVTLGSMSILTGTGSAGTIPVWTGALTQGNSLLSDNGTTLNYTGGTITTATGYQIGGGGGATAGNYLRGNGTHFVSSGIQAGDVPTLNQSTTGTASNVTGVVLIANGGTGQTTQQAAINALTGTQTNGLYLRSNGTNATLSALNGADLTAASVTVAKISATGTPSATTYLRGDGSWSTPPAGGGGSAPTLVDANAATLGVILGFNYDGSVNIMTSTGHFISIYMDPVGGNNFPINQIYWTGAACSGTPYLNDGGSTGDKRYYKQLAYSGQTGSLYEMGSPNANGASTSVAFAAVSIENPGCMASGGASGWPLTAKTNVSVGLPAAIAYPLTVTP
jgi:hypothetical protein